MTQLPDDILREIADALDGCRVVPDAARDGAKIFWLVADAPGEFFHGAGGDNRIIPGHRILALIEPHSGELLVDHYHANLPDQDFSCTRWAHVGPTHDPNLSPHDPEEKQSLAQHQKRIQDGERLKESGPITPENLKLMIISLLEGTHGADYDKTGHSKLLLGVSARHRTRAGAMKTQAGTK